MPNTKIAIITGSPGVGKTTVAHRTCEIIQQHLNCIAIHIEVDDVRWMVLGDNSDYGSHPIWLDLVESIASKSMNFAEVIIIEGLFFELQTVEKLFTHYPGIQIFLLDAPLEVCLDRNRSREAVSEHLDDEELKSLHLIIRPSSWERLDASLPVETLAMQLVRKIL
jgi:tRNA uridine 5-carbamoylmethylation protein Kti12